MLTSDKEFEKLTKVVSGEETASEEDIKTWLEDYANLIKEGVQGATAKLVVTWPAKAGHVSASCSICDRTWWFSEKTAKSRKNLYAHVLEETPYCNCGAKFVGVI